jgi:hypothetical protein
MAYIAVVPPIRFINITSPVGPTDVNHPDDVLVIRAFLIYLTNFRKDLHWTQSRLSTLAGPADSALFKMIEEYKDFKNANPGPNQVHLGSEEMGKGRVLPQDERFAFGPIRTTILALNSDVQPLAGYGDTIIDVMCNLFPIADLFNGSVRADSYWRNLARKQIPWQLWLPKQQEDASQERMATIRRQDAASNASGAIDWEQRAADNELFTLLQPYYNDMKQFYERHSETCLDVNPGSPIKGQNVTLTASVRLPTGIPPSGTITFEMSVGGVAIVGTVAHCGVPHNVATGGLRLQQLGRMPLANGSATFSTSALPQGLIILRAIFPDTGTLIGSRDEVPIRVN